MTQTRFFAGQRGDMPNDGSLRLQYDRRGRGIKCTADL